MIWQANDTTARELGLEVIAETDCINREWSTTSDLNAWKKAAGRLSDAIAEAEQIWREEGRLRNEKPERKFLTSLRPI